MYFKSLFNRKFILMLLLALFMPWKVHAQETLTVCDGTTTNSYIPFYGLYVDTQGTTSEFIIPASTSGMNDLAGSEITKLTFYISNPPTSWGSPTFQIYMGEVSGTTINSLYGPNNSNVIVYEGVLSNTQSTMEIVLQTPYNYGGGNLLIGTYVKTKSSSYKSTSFYGTSASSGASRYNNGSGNGTAQSFLPKTTFTYTAGCARPASVTTGNITSNSATINWAGGSGKYNIEYKTTTETGWTSKANNYIRNSINLTSLESGTSYQARVQSICEEGKLSNWVSVDFSTLCVPTDNFPFSENFDGLTSGIPMCWDNSEGTTTNDSYKWNYHATGHNGKCVRFNSYNNSNGLTNFLKTRAMNLPAGQTMQVCFWYKNPTGGDFSIYLSDDGGTTHTTVLETGMTGQTEWTEMEIAFPNDYIGKDNVVVVFKGTSNYGNGDAYIYLDDVIVEPQPNCPKPTELHTNEVTARTAKLQWTPGSSDQNHWELYLTQSQTDEPNNDTPASTGYDNITENPFTLHSLTPEATYYAYVRANCGGGDKSKWSLVCPFTMEPSCYQPTNLQTPLVTSSSVELQWSITSEPDSYDILITQDASLVPNENTQPSKSGITEHPYTYDEDIQPQATYYAFVRANCGSTDGYSPWSNRVTFTTPCEANTVFPFTENFDNLTTNGQIPDCWDNEERNGYYSPYSHYEWCYYNTSTSGHNNSKCVRFDSEYNNRGNINYLKTPLMNFPAGKPMQLRFWYKNATGGDFSVYISTDGGQTHSTALAQSLPNVSSWTEKEIPLPSNYIGGQNIVIVFKGTSNYEEDGVILLDDVTIEEAPSCNFPRNLTLTGFSGINPILGWTAYGTETQWQISYSTTSGDHNTIAEAGSNPFTLTGLNPQTKYYVSVRAKCSETEHSAWSDEISFNTPQTPVTVDAQHPFDDSFEGNECGWLLENGNLTNQWHWGTATNNGGTKSIYVSNDGGMTNAYTYSQATNVYATKTFSCEQDGIYQFSYDWHAKGDSYGAYDWMRVALVPATVEFTASSTTPSGLTANGFPASWQAIALDGGTKLWNSTNWQNKAVEVELTAGTYKMVFIWRNNTYYQNQEKQPPAAIDNVHISVVSCAQPTELTVTAQARTATVTWNAGNDSQWQVAYGTVSGEPDENTFQTVTAATCSFSGLTPETDYYAFVRTVCGEGNYSEWSEQSFTTTEACPAPTNLTYSNVGPYTAAVSWTAGATGQTAWNLQYKKHNDSQWSETIEINNAAAYQLTGLSPITSYDVQVQAVCDGEDGASEWLTRTNLFTTDCGTMVLPYSYGFEDNLQSGSYPMPKCWNRIAYSSSTNPNAKYPYIYEATSSQPYAHGENGNNSASGHSLYLWRNSSSSNETAILPEIDDSYDMSMIQISFWARLHNNATNQTLSIGVMSSTSSGYSEVATVNIESDHFTPYTVSLANYTGTGRYIAFKCGSGSDVKYYIDDITINYIPSCQIPSGLAATVNSATQTTLTWQPGGNETDWELEVTAENSGVSQTIPVTGNPTYTLTTNRATTYSVIVRANCGDGDYSDWSNPISFTTDCGILPVDAQNPFIEDFNGETFPPTCWQKVNFGEMGETNGWQVNMNNNLDNQGAVSSDFKNETWLFLPHMHIEGNATLSFDNLFSSGSVYAPSSIMVSTETFEDLETIKDAEFIVSEHFTSIWTADANHLPGSKQNETVSLSNYNGQDVHIAFRYEGTYAIDQIIWYIDNVHVFVPVTQTVTLSQGWNWWSPTVETSLEELETALGDKGATIMSQNSGIATYDDDEEEWSGSLTSLVPGQMYLIQVNEDCSFILSGSVLSSVTITIEQGSNWFGYTGMQSVTIEQALNGFAPAENDRIFSFDEGFSTYDGEEWSGTFSHLRPGHGYIYISQDVESKTINF